MGSKAKSYRIKNVVSYHDKITPETLSKIIAMWPDNENMVIAKEVGLTESQLIVLAVAIRKNGIELFKKKRVNLVDLVAEALKKLEK